jgi:acetyl esterase/lipase
VRENAGKWSLRTDRVGILGFSAGGHLASTAGTHFYKPVIENKNGTGLRPDFMILVYPVISFDDSIGHHYSKENLLGKNPPASLVQLYSNELQVKPDTPPTFLVHASDDDGVSPLNSVRFYEALIKNKVPAEMHLYKGGGHGFGLNNHTTSEKWMDACAAWMDSNGWFKH